MPGGLYDGVHVPISVRYVVTLGGIYLASESRLTFRTHRPRLRYDLRPASHGRLSQCMEPPSARYYSPRGLTQTQIFGYRDDALPLGWNISTERQQLISSLMTLGAFISSCFAGPIATYVGRKGSIWIASAMCCTANVIMMASTDIGAVYFGRLLIGLANGMFMTFSQLYIQVSVCGSTYQAVLFSDYQHH